MKDRLERIYRTFPIQLLLLQVKHNLFQLLLWLGLFSVVSGGFGRYLGLHYFFLDPEYLGRVSFFSFYIIGLTLGAFYLAWNTTTYILNSHRFPFLASLNKPFLKFSINNSVIPVLFMCYYIYKIIAFQWYNEYAEEHSLVFFVLGFFLGLISMIFMAMMYFYLTNKDIIAYRKKHQLKLSAVLKSVVVKRREQRLKTAQDNPYRDACRVDYYLTEGLKWRLVRNVRHYNFKLLERVFRQNHANALVIHSLSITALILMSALVEYEYCRIPTAASLLILMSIISTIVGAIMYWMQAWSIAFIGGLIVCVNQFMSMGLVPNENKAYGLDYTKQPIPYNNAVLDSICSKSNYRKDVKNTLNILKIWRSKFRQSQVLRKPKLVVLCFSGGGVRAGLWTTHVLQQLDKELKGKLMKHTVLMTGASGGMLGAGYFRELYLQKKIGASIDLQSPKLLENSSKDLANALTFTFLVNDIFVPWVNRTVNGYKYKQDRGYMFEQQLIENTDGHLGHSLKYYEIPEQKGVVPMMFVTPYITNDGRMLIISPQGVSYMMRPPFIYQGAGDGDFAEIDGVDFGALFRGQNAYNMRFATALRMNATFPFVFPNVQMPTVPNIEIMDAGIRDNFGLESATRFLAIFRNWILKNTSGVTIVSVRSYQKENEIPKQQPRTIGNTIFNPISSVMGNDMQQDFHHDTYIAFLKSKIGYDKVDLVRFNYRPSRGEEKASLSLHLTEREKRDVLNAFYLKENQKNLRKLKELVK